MPVRNGRERTIEPRPGEPRDLARLSRSPSFIAAAMTHALPIAGFPERRLGPRMSLVLVLPGSEPVISEQLAQRLNEFGDRVSDVIVACAGPASDLRVLETLSSRAQFVLAPTGTTTEALRELGMQLAPGDIVTVLEGHEHRVRRSHQRAGRGAE